MTAMLARIGLAIAAGAIGSAIAIEAFSPPVRLFLVASALVTLAVIVVSSRVRLPRPVQAEQSDNAHRSVGIAILRSEDGETR